MKNPEPIAPQSATEKYHGAPTSVVIACILYHMAYDEIIAGIETEISRLQEVRRLLTGLDTIPGTSAKGGIRKSSASNVSAPVEAKRTVSAEGKARMAEAQKKRWAAKKRADKKAAKEGANAGQ